MPEHVIDTNVLIHGAERPLPFEDMMTVPQVTEEVRSRTAGNRMDVEEIAVYEPTDEALAQVAATEDDLGEELADADTAVIALALERDAVLVSDDYGVQNVATALGVDVEPFLTDGIDEVRSWKTVCENCGADASGEQCQRCGGAVTRVPR